MSVTHFRNTAGSCYTLGSQRTDLKSGTRRGSTKAKRVVREVEKVKVRKQVGPSGKAEREHK
jgi:hypothetical protein